jgi:uncharacterized protein with PIN domain
MNCPNCNNPLEENPCNGGKLIVMESVHNDDDLETYDPDIEAYKCTQCGKNVYIS